MTPPGSSQIPTAAGAADQPANVFARLPSVAPAPLSLVLDRSQDRDASAKQPVTPGGSAPAPPASTAASAVRPTAPAARDEEEVRRAVGRYQSAYERLDAGAAKDIWPSVNEAALARAFENLESQDLTLSNCRVEVTGVRAQASCTGTARYVKRVGSRTAQQDQRQWIFKLRKDAASWRIDSVQIR